MKLRGFFIYLLVSVFGLGVIRAEPENFMIEGVTFKRPANWDWIVPDSEVRRAQLKVCAATKLKCADVIFYWFPVEDKQGDPDGCVKRWQAQFHEKLQPTIERSAVGGFKLTLAQMEGTYKGFGKEGLSLLDHRLYGAIVQTGAGSIMIRMTGPKETVSSAGKKFKEMIEEALKEE